MTDYRSRMLDAAARRRAAEYATLTGRGVLTEAEARAICRAFQIVGPPVTPGLATSRAATPSEIVEAGEIRRGERHNERPPPQPARRMMTPAEIVAAAKKADTPT